MPPLPFYAELRLTREFEELLEVQFNYTGNPDHPQALIQKLERICRRLLKTQIPKTYNVEEEMTSCDDPAITDIVLRRKELTDSHIIWLRNHLKRGFEMRALFGKKDIEVILDDDVSARWVIIPSTSGHKNVAQRAIRQTKTSPHKHRRTSQDRAKRRFSVQ